LVWFPDDQAGWLPFAVAGIVAAHRREPLAAVVSSASPFTAHVAGLIGSRLIGVPWIADFRDPWLDNPIEPPQTGFARWRRATLEAVLVRTAARCTFATPSLTATYQRRYPHHAARMSTLPNGYEPAASSPGTTPPVAGQGAGPGAPRPFRLVYAGSLYRPAEVDVLLDGVCRAVDRRPDLVDRLRVVFVGTVTAECRAVADRYLADSRLARMVELTGFVPRAQAQAAIADADAALTLLGAGPGMEMFIGAKLYDYLAQDRQVLAVVPEGDARALLADLRWGVVADPEPDAVAEALVAIVDAPPPAGRADPEGRYLRSTIARRLGRLLDEVAGRDADGGAAA
jgi:glycosyltransferase involved in cell wall biosynthesis